MNNAAKPRILLVEDDLTVQNLVSTALDLHGYVVSKVCDGQAAIMDAVARPQPHHARPRPSRH